MTHPVKFEVRYPKSRPQGEDWVLLAPIGKGADKVQSWHRVRKLQPVAGLDAVEQEAPHHQAMLARWQIIGPRYEAWKAGQEIPVDGTPLGAWAQLNPAQVDVLRKLNILTVEAVAEMGVSQAADLHWPGAMDLPKLAKAFLSGQGEAEKDRQILEMQERMAAMEEMLQAARTEEPKKRGPGRPRKEAEAAA